MNYWLFEKSTNSAWQYIWKPNDTKTGWETAYYKESKDCDWVKSEDEEQLDEDFDPRKLYTGSDFKRLKPEDVFALLL